MKKVRYIIFVLLIALAVNVKAARIPNCESKEFTRLKEIAKKIEFDYDYKVENDKAVFTINAYNLHKDIRSLIIEDYYSDKYKEFKDSGNGEGKLEGFEQGSRVVVTMKGYVANWCSGETILTKTVRLPYYNKYYDEEKCKGHEDFKYCKKLIDNNISEEEYNKQFARYLANNGRVDENGEVIESSDSKILLIVVGIIVIISIVSFVVIKIIKRRKKNEL